VISESQPIAAAPVQKRALSRADYERFEPIVRRLAMRTARRVPRHILVSDLVSDGWLGLVEAFGRAEAMPEEEFIAYATYRIRGAMLDHLRSLDSVSRSARGKSREVARAIAELTRELARQPEENEIAGRLELSVEGYQALLDTLAKAGMSRLEMLDIDHSDVESTFERPDESLLREDIQKSVARAINTLPERQQQVLALYYQEECTLREIGLLLEVTESRVSQLHTEAIHRLRAAIGKE
jgi:RNA polymerase sigma factor for flagellar operon FliA